MPWRTVIAWLLVLPLAGWFVLRAFGATGGAEPRSSRSRPASSRAATTSGAGGGGGAVRVLAGDFNATLGHAELRRVIARDYEDAADERGKGLHPTWPTNGRRTLPVTIDHVLADERCGFRDLQTFDVAGSDHRAVLVELVLPRG